jgi:hypothetical protein
MPKCPKCGAAMSTVLRRRNGVVETYYECPACTQDESGEDGDIEPEQSALYRDDPMTFIVA